MASVTFSGVTLAYGATYTVSFTANGSTISGETSRQLITQQPGRYAAISPLEHPARLGRLHFVQARLPAPHPDALAALREAGVKVEVTLKPEATHFDVITPGAPAYDSVEPQLLALLRR